MRLSKLSLRRSYSVVQRRRSIPTTALPAKRPTQRLKFLTTIISNNPVIIDNMARVDVTSLKSKFETGDRPTGQDYVDLIDTLISQATR